MSKTNNKNVVERRNLSTVEKLFGKVYVLLPILFILIVVPLIVKVKAFDPRMSEFVWYSAQNVEYDYYLYYKQWFFVGACASLFIFFAIYMKKEKIKLRLPLIYIPIFLYALLAILSTVTSEYMSFGLSGISEQFENIFCLIGYALIPFYLYFAIQSEEGVKSILGALYIQIAIMSIIGFSQAAGKNILNSGIIKEFIMASNEPIPPTNLTGGNTPLTLYNRNYSGVYFAMVLPVLTTLLIFAKTWKYRLITGALFLAMLACMISSGSKAAFIGYFAGLVVLIFVLRKFIKRYWKQSLAVIGTGVLAFAIFLVATGGSYLKEIWASVTSVAQKSEYALKGIRTEDTSVVVTYNTDELSISMDWYEQEFLGFFLNDGNGEPVAAQFQENSLVCEIVDERFPNITLEPCLLFDDDIMAFTLMIDNTPYYFTNQSEDGTYYIVNWYGKLDKIYKSESAVFTNYPNMFSGRGYIWSKTIPLLKENILLGSGADTFTLVYPQRDYVDLQLNGYGGLLTTKPHNMYLLIGVQTGIVSLICFVVFYLLYFIWSIKILLKETFTDYLPQAGAAVLTGTFAYMVMGITNDSCIAVAPIFFILLGLGIAINAILHKKQKEKREKA